MVAYDLDGVLTPDMRFKESRLKRINKVRRWMLPILQPLGDWGILTSRDPRDFNEVSAWVKKNFNCQPRLIVMTRYSSEDPVSYKIRILEELQEVHTYIESCSATAAGIRRGLSRPCKVVSLSQLLNQNGTYVEEGYP